jgi:galactokinase
VAVARALATLAGVELPPREAALLGQRVESGFVGVACGIMDQFASALAERRKALHLWCDTADVEHVAMHDAVLIFDTAVSRSLRGSDFNLRRAECEEALRLLRRLDPELPTLAAATPEQVHAAALPSPLDRRALHVTEETRRVQQTVTALRATGTLPGELMYKSHESLRSLYECSTVELDWFVERAARADGVRGARLTGAGWGGCAIAVGDETALAAAAPAITAEYLSRFGITPRVWITHAEAGARVES